ncbi:MAG: hypothetical protein IJ120_02720 [Solobacterium sp.]|nr:hypothetical protein [Solobacterium sp.]
MKLNNKTYDLLKILCTTVLPAVATLFIAVGQIWHWDTANLIAATITAVATCIGTIIKMSSDSYWGGNGVG